MSSSFHIEEMCEGTGFYRENHIYHLGESGEISNVEYVSPAVAYTDKLRPGEGVWKGVGTGFTDKELVFGFDIWNEDDANCCPSAGSVTGRFEIVEEKPLNGSVASVYRMVPVEFNRGPSRYADTPGQTGEK